MTFIYVLGGLEVLALLGIVAAMLWFACSPNQSDE